MECDADAESLAYGEAIYWYDSESESWYRYNGTRWTGWRCNYDKSPSSKRIMASASPKPSAWRPWFRLLDISRYPYMHWFEGCMTNATFSALDVPVLEGKGSMVAFESASRYLDNEAYASITRAELIGSVCIVGRRLRSDLGVANLCLRSERCLLHARTGFEQIVYILACARLGIVYTCTAIDAADDAISHRLSDFKPTLLVATIDGDVQDAALPGSDAASRIRQLHGSMSVDQRGRRVTVLYTISHVDSAKMTRDPEMMKNGMISQNPWLPVAVPVADSHAMCVVYTSGSTGKPKGIVHCHGGYAASLSRSMKFTFDPRSHDKFLTVGSFAWITGQSYMLIGPLLAGCQSMIIEGSPLGPDGLRWARIAKACNCTILKIATAFVRQAMANSGRRASLLSMDLRETLRLATFCAEPVSVEVQSWACQVICPYFFNSYWATEHGSIVLTWRPEQPNAFKPDTKCWPVPWVQCMLDVSSQSSTDAVRDIVLLRPYAGLARTVWGDIPGYEKQGVHWVGDVERFFQSYFSPIEDNGFTFIQGDAARVDPADGGWTFHGRTDEVLNVSGVRIGVEEIEKVLWRVDGVCDLAVVGAPHTIKGQLPIAFIVLRQPEPCAPSSLRRFRAAARAALGTHAEPDVILTSELPRTITGKVTRSLLRAALLSGTTDPVSVNRSVSNVDAYWSCLDAARDWRCAKATFDIPLLNECAWDYSEFACHQVAGSPLVPATGWLDALRRAFSCKCVENVHFLREVRRKASTYVARNVGNAVFHIIEVGDGTACLNCETEEQVCVRATFPTSKRAQPLLHALRNFNRSSWDCHCDVLDDIDAHTHYRRCRAIGLYYSGPFKSVVRIIWRTDFTFRAHVHLPSVNVAALFDAALQVVCSLDALGAGVAFIPYAVKRYLLDDGELEMREALILGEVRTRTASVIDADFAFVEVSSEHISRNIIGDLSEQRSFAIMLGVLFSRLDKTQRVGRKVVSSNDVLSISQNQNPWTSTTQLSQSRHESETRVIRPQMHVYQSRLAGNEAHSAEIQEKVLRMSESVVGGTIDPTKSLFENGLSSLRGIELLGKINDVFGVSLGPRAVTTRSTFEDLYTSLELAVKTQSEAMRSMAKGDARFAHVDKSALKKIVEARLNGDDAHNVGWKSHERYSDCVVFLREVGRALLYMMRRGFVRYLCIQYHDGLLHFLLNPPASIDLDLEVIVPGSVVAFHQTDYNRHFTVREIVRDSERGFYNLIHASGLAHLEHYFRVMFFASRLEARFDVELLEGEPYEMRAHITAITGPLLDIQVDFFKKPRRKQDVQRTFAVTWRLMLVTDAERKQMYDFQHGGALCNVCNVDARHEVSGKHTGDILTANVQWRKEKALRISSTAIVACILSVAVPFMKLTRVFCSTLTSTSVSPFEATVVLSALLLWVRISSRPDGCYGPVEVLLPHG